MQRECYDEIRVRFGLPAQMACNVPRQVGATSKGLWTKARQNAKARAEGRSKKPYKGLDQAPHYVSPTLTYNYHRDYSLKADHHVSILTLAGRVIMPYTGYAKHVTLASAWGQDRRGQALVRQTQEAVLFTDFPGSGGGRSYAPNAPAGHRGGRGTTLSGGRGTAG